LEFETHYFRKYGHLKKGGFEKFGTVNYTAVEMGREI
jgi:hypothetical protein